MTGKSNTARWLTAGFLIFLAAALLLACRLPTISLPGKKPQTLKLKTAQMAVKEVSTSDRFPAGCSAGPSCNVARTGYMILTVALERADGGSMEEIKDAMWSELRPLMGSGTGHPYITGREGNKTYMSIISYTTSNNAFILVFTPAQTDALFKLTWADDQVIDLGR
ncbi:MAG TPA: hypothetical protein VIO61_00950 [Anaerolineaceae bacterium]